MNIGEKFWGAKPGHDPNSSSVDRPSISPEGVPQISMNNKHIKDDVDSSTLPRIALDSTMIQRDHARIMQDHARVMQDPVRVLKDSVRIQKDSKNGRHNSSDAEDNNNGSESAPPSSPLDFSMKKRKILTQPADNNVNGSKVTLSAFENVSSNGQKFSPTQSSLLLQSSPLLTSGHFFQQKTNNNSSLLAQHLAAQPQQNLHKNGAANQRPFKAYDPMKPTAVLNANSLLQHTPPMSLHHNLTTASSLLNTTGLSPHHHLPPLPQPPHQQLMSDQLLAQYCQYLLSTQALASMGTNGNGNVVNNSHMNLNASNNKLKSPLSFDDSAFRQHSLLASRRGSMMITTPVTKNGNGVTVSPPQVTSTSHPHVDSCATPPASSGMDSSSSSVGNGGESYGAESCGSKSSPNDDNHDEDRSECSPTPASINGGANGTGGENGAAAVNGRRRGKSLPEELKDEAYWERRRKNNEAAKRSRDLRRAKEDEIALRAALLEQENARLRIEVAALKTETEKLRQMLLNS